MNQPDTLDLTLIPFYEWDTFVPPKHDEEENVGVAMMDSLFAPRETPEPVLRQSLFRGHTLSVAKQETTERQTDTPPAWTFAIVLLLIALLCHYYRSHSLSLRKVAHMAISRRVMERTLREHNLNHSFQLSPMGILAAATISLSVFHMAMMHTGIAGFAILTAALIAAYFVRWWLMWLLGASFNNSDAVSLYIINGYLYHILLATAVIPLLLLQLYMPDGKETVFYIIATITGIIFLARTIRGMKIFLKYSHSANLYLFYYLCIVEIAPILVLTKWFID